MNNRYKVKIEARKMGTQGDEWPVRSVEVRAPSLTSAVERATQLIEEQGYMHRHVRGASTVQRPAPIVIVHEDRCSLNQMLDDIEYDIAQRLYI